MSEIHRRDFLVKASAVCGAGAAIAAVPVPAEQADSGEGSGAASEAHKGTVRSPELDKLRERLMEEAPLQAFTRPL